MGQHFEECMPAIRIEVDKFIDQVLIMKRKLTLDKTFNMQKNDIARLPEGHNHFIVGLGWECPPRFGDIDLDASIICLDKDKNIV
jgi:hypothetical protein